MTNDFIDGNTFFNVFIFLPDSVAEKLQSKVSKIM